MNLLQLKNSITQSAIETGFSGGVSLAQNNQTIFSFYTGYADQDLKLKNNITTKFGLASITKFFTALAILKYDERGVISLDDKLGDIINTALPNYAKTVTFQQLLTHTSGIPDYYDESSFSMDGSFKVAIPWYNLRRPIDYIPILPTQPLKFKAGDGYDYNNSGYILLGIALEILSGELFSQVIQTEILTPLNMLDTGFFAFDSLPKNTAIGYIKNDDATWSNNQSALPFIGASDGGIYSNMADLNKMWRGFWQKKIVSQTMINNIIHPHISRDPSQTSKHYGLGIYIDNGVMNSKKYSLIGADPGVNAYTDFHHATKFQSTVLSNNCQGKWVIVSLLQDYINNQLQ